jgi:hypothetical protein
MRAVERGLGHPERLAGKQLRTVAAFPPRPSSEHTLGTCVARVWGNDVGKDRMALHRTSLQFLSPRSPHHNRDVKLRPSRIVSSRP